MKKNFLCALALTLVLQGCAQALEEDYSPIVLSDGDTTTFFSKIKKDEIYTLDNFKESAMGASANIDVVTRRDIERSNSPSLTSVLNSMGSVTTQSAGSEGSVTSLRIRGTDRVRMTVDGIRVDRVTGTSPGVSPAYTLIDDLERIEVIKGPQGNVSGVNASGGVISMQTRRGEGPFKVELGSEMGGYGMFKERFALMGSDETVDYYLSTTWYKTDGGLRTRDMGRLYNDGYKNFSVATNLGVKLFDDHAEIRNIFRMSNATKGTAIGYDDSYARYNDQNNYLRNIDILETLTYSHAVNDYYNYNVKFGLYHNDTNDHIIPDDFKAQYENTAMSSTRLNLMTQHDIHYKKWNTLSLGYNLEGEFMDYDDIGGDSWGGKIDRRFNASTAQNDVYVNDVVNIKDILFVRGGARLVHHSDYGTYVTPNASAALVLPTFKLSGAKTKFRGSWGRSVNTPTLYQRFASVDYGYSKLLPNPNINAEKLTGWDAGIEQSFMDEKLKFDFGWFKSDYKDYIGYFSDPVTWNGWYYNIASANLHGLEGKVTFEPNDKFKIVGNYTYTDTEDGKTKADLAAVPRNRYNATLYYTPFERWNIFAGIETASSRFSVSGDSKSKTKGYVDARIGTSVRLFTVKNLSVFLKGTMYNLFNQNICMYKDSYNNYDEFYGPKIRFNAGIFMEFVPGKDKEKTKDRV